MNQEKDFARIIELLEEINRKLTPVTPSAPLAFATACNACGIKFSGPVGYACPRSDCPTFMVAR